MPDFLTSEGGSAALLAALLSGLAVVLLVIVLARQGALARREDGLERVLREEAAIARREAADSAGQLRGEIQSQMKTQFDFFATQLRTFETRLTESSGQLRQTVETQLATLRGENEKKLEEMRRTVDEKLQGTLEKRLGESFKQVSDRLEAVHKGLGEMQTLATGVGDLKRVLSNVKTRGTWGEVALGNLLDQTLTADQYAANVAISEHSSERVEYAIRLPGREADGGTVWLPIDAKFPVEDWERLQVAADAGDQEAVLRAGKELEARIRGQAGDISTKYIDPPRSTDFAILFLPTEGLYAEVVRRPGLIDELQRRFRVVVAGPTTFAALLNSLQMGFRTLAIERRSSEVWQVLGAVKTEFGRFGEVLDRVKKQLQAASNTIDRAGIRERAIQRRLREVEALPAAEAAEFLPAPDLPASDLPASDLPAPDLDEDEREPEGQTRG